jgi:hypothetical protein
MIIGCGVCCKRRDQTQIRESFSHHKKHETKKCDNMLFKNIDNQDNKYLNPNINQYYDRTDSEKVNVPELNMIN